MALNSEIIDKLYNKYGYRQINKSSSIKLFLYEQGRYFGADIIPLDNDPDTLLECENLKKEYSEGGYAVQIKNYPDDETVGNELYKSFFSYETTKKRINNKYLDFKSSQKKLNGGFNYEYINSPYRINYENEEKTKLTTAIIDKFLNVKPQLIIIEASAGYGKTCTAFEILKKLLDCPLCGNPLMTVLSRNRGANIFRYILLDEIDREYSTLDSNLVTYEISTGRIPLIIDGFDELLKKSEIVKTEKDKVFIEVETMLDTIGNLLKGNARVILTSRKTAIFAGEEFQNWLSKWNNEFDVSRFSITTPRIKDWLTPEKVEAIKQAQIPVEYIANPVLLTYLRNLDQSSFSLHISEPDTIIKKYFYSLHLREMTRQELHISPENQYIIFKNVVRLLIGFDQSTQERSFFRDIILDQNKGILEDALKLYPSDKDNEWLADKLITHALLDRKGEGENEIGFINDFIFGTFVGEIMTETTVEEIDKSFSAYMIETGATAYIVQNSNNKILLWDKIEALKEKFENSSLFNFDITLKGKLERNYVDSIFQSVQVYKIIFNNGHIINSSVFIGCKFKKCEFYPETFESVSFIECLFEECIVNGVESINDFNNCYTIKCSQKKCSVLSNQLNYSESEDKDLQIILENRILEELYSIEKLFKSQRIMHLMTKFNRIEHRLVAKTIDKLLKEKIINVNGSDIFIEINKIGIVKERIRK